MSQLTVQRILNAFHGLFSSLDATDDALLKACTGARFKARVYLSDLATAATAQTATPFFTNDLGCTLSVISAKLIVPIAVTADASNKMTCTLTKVDATGLNPATVAAATTDLAGGSLVAHLPKLLAPTVANAALPSGWTLHAAVSKAGSGVAFTAATSQAYLEVVLEVSA